MYAISNHTQVVSLPSFHVCQKGDVGHNWARWHLLSGKYFNWFYMSVKQFCSFSKFLSQKQMLSGAEFIVKGSAVYIKYYTYLVMFESES